MSFLHNVVRGCETHVNEDRFFLLPFGEDKCQKQELCATNKGRSDSNKGCSSRKGNAFSHEGIGGLAHAFFFESINVRLGVHGRLKMHAFEAPIILFLL
jgi:hypothetical protein